MMQREEVKITGGKYMSDENNMFEPKQPSRFDNDTGQPDGSQQPGGTEQMSYNQSSSGGPVHLEKDQQPQYSGEPGRYNETMQSGYNQQPGYNQQQPGYNQQPGNQQQPGYNQQPGNQQQTGYNQQYNQQQTGYNQQYDQQQNYQQPYGGQNQYTQNTGYAEPVFQQESHSTVSVESGGFGIASMICGIIALLTCCLWCLCIPLAVVSIVLGILQLQKGTAKGMAIAGIVCSGIALVLLIILTVWGSYLRTSGAYYDIMRELQYMHHI